MPSLPGEWPGVFRAPAMQAGATADLPPATLPATTPDPPPATTPDPPPGTTADPLPATTAEPLPAAPPEPLPGTTACMPPPATCAGTERGSAIVEFVFLAVLLMVPVAYLILTVGQLQGGAYAVVGAADQAAKVYVLQPDAGAARQAAETAVAMAVTDLGFDAANASLTIICDGGCLTPGTIVRARVTLNVELPLVGGIPGARQSAATVESSATQKVGRFK